MAKLIVEENVRKTSTKVGFYQDVVTSSLETMRKWYEIDVTIEIDSNPLFKEWTLTKLSSGKIFVHHDGLTYELELGESEPMGVIITKSKPIRITKVRMLELFRSGTPFYDSPRLDTQCVSFVKR